MKPVVWRYLARFMAGVAPCQDAKPVVLDLVQPLRAARRGFGWGRQAEFDRAGYAAATL
jgi:hypothetical protein